MVYVTYLQSSQSQQLLLFWGKRELPQPRNVCRNGSKVPLQSQEEWGGNGVAASESAELL